MRRMFPVVIALILIVVIAVCAIRMRSDKEDAYGTEVMDLRTYFEAEDGKLAILNQTEKLAEKAILKDGTSYVSYNFAKNHLSDNFYYDWVEQKLLFTDAEGTFEAVPGELTYLKYGEEVGTTAPVCYLEGIELQLSLPYAAMLSGVDYNVNEYRIQLRDSWDPYEAILVTKDTKMRLQGDPQSAILSDAKQGDTLALLETFEEWSRVANDDGIIGYVENKCLGATVSVAPEKPSGEKEYLAPEYGQNALREKVCLGWHAIGGVGGNDTLEEMISTAEGMNVISPTWYSLNDNDGGFRNFASASYVQRAHKYGLEVWGALDDFNYEGETGENIDDTVILSSTTKRAKLVNGIIAAALEVGMDGINLDFEKVGTDCAEHYGQFLKELSVACKKNNLKLSVDNYVPNEGNRQYRLDVQGKVADYVILMGYDEHWHGCGVPGSVASIGFISNGISKALQSVPANKLVNAIPFYTIQWKTDGTSVSDDYLTLVNQSDFLSRIGVEPTWDEMTCQNYVEWSSNDVTYKVWLEDLDSISVKLNVMSANELAGVAAWRLGYGTQDAWTLLAAFKQM